jgi:hypothetical protein
MSVDERSVSLQIKGSDLNYNKLTCVHPLEDVLINLLLATLGQGRIPVLSKFQTSFRMSVVDSFVRFSSL